MLQVTFYVGLVIAELVFVGAHQVLYAVATGHLVVKCCTAHLAPMLSSLTTSTSELKSTVCQRHATPVWQQRQG